MNNRTIYITQSQIRCFINCRRRYFLEYIECLKPLKYQEALKIGLEYHAAIAGEKELISSVAIALKKAYDKYIHIDYMAKEKEYEYHLGYGIYLKGKLDGLTQDAIVEHKTAAEVDDSYFCNLQKDIQVSAYMLSQEMNRMIYTVIQKPTIRLKKNETQEKFAQRLISWYDDTEVNYNKVFIRVEARTNEDLLQCKKELHQIAKEIRNCKCYYRNPGACSIFPCAYSSICLSHEPQSVPIGYEHKERVNEELSK